VSGASASARTNLIVASVLLLGLSFLPGLVQRFREQSAGATPSGKG
jgi:hypothetical protein